MSVSALLLRARGGDELAFRRLLDDHSDLIELEVGRFFASNGLSLDDFRQEARIAFCKAIKDFRPNLGNSFRSFASFCIRRHLVTTLRLSRAGKHGPVNDGLSFAAPLHSQEGDTLTIGDRLADPDSDPAVGFLKRQRFAGVVDAIGRLSSRERSALLLLLNGYTYEEISERLSIDFSSIDNAIQRARRKLREEAA